MNEEQDEAALPPPAPDLPLADTDAYADVVRKSKSLSYQGIENAQSLWLISFSDLMALMLAFFVLMYSMSSPREDKWVEMSTSLEGELGTQGDYKGSEWNEGRQDTIQLQQGTYGRALNINYLRTVLADLLKADRRLEKLTLRTGGDELTLALPEDIIFDDKTGRISESGELVLSALADLLGRIDNRTSVSGNVDEIFARAHGQNQWNYALSRAALVAAALNAEGYDRMLEVQAAYDGRAATPGELSVIITADDGTELKSLSFEGAAP